MIKTKNEALVYLTGLDDDAIVEIEKKREKTLRSMAQNRYYWGVIIPTISDYHGYITPECHEMLKSMFRIETTTNISSSDFTFFTEKIRELRKWKFNLYIPSPNEVEDMKNLEKYI